MTDPARVSAGICGRAGGDLGPWQPVAGAAQIRERSFQHERNLGGAVGIAVCGAILNARTNFHFDSIASHLTPANGPMQRLISEVGHRYGANPGSSADAGHSAALKQLWHLAYREASTLAYADAFRAIMLAFLVATLLVPLLRQVAPPKAPSASSH